MKILVLGGGESSEREVSLRSAVAVREALAGLGHQVGFFDPKGQMDRVAGVAKDYDLVMPILHGTGGEDGRVQRELDKSGVPYLGADTEASEVCFDKPRLLKLLAVHGIPVPKGDVVDWQGFLRSELVKRPFVLKPMAQGSSVDTYIERQAPVDLARFEHVFLTYGHMLLEELVEGVEITVPVLGEAALPVIEIVPPDGKEFDYENKYNGATTELCPPQHVNARVQERAQRLAEQVHELSGARHLSRTDMIVRPGGELAVLEINTMPGMTAQSLFPKSAAVAGLPWKQLVAKLVELAS